MRTVKIKEYLKDFNYLENFRMLATNIRGDVVGGITTGIIALPLLLAFGVSSGMGAKAGLIGAVALGFFAAVFGGTPAQISGPTAPMTVIVAAIAVQYSDQPFLIFQIIALGGIFQIVLGLTKVGRYIQYMPYPVVSGFMNGIGVIIFLTQINAFFGLEAIGNPGAAFMAIPHSVMSLNPAATAIGCFTLILVYALPRINRHFPGTIVAIVAMTLAAQILHLDIARIGDIPVGLPSFQKLHLNWPIFSVMVGPAIVLAVMGLLDSLLTSLIADRLTATRHNSNRELIGQGLGNCLTGLLGGIPGAGATIRTEINIRNGGKTPLAGVVYAALTLASMLFLGQWLKFIPLTCLAAVLFKAAVDIMDFKILKQIHKIPFFDIAVLVVVLLLTVAINIMVAVGVGLLLACILFVKRMGDLLAIDAVTLNDVEKSWVADESWHEKLTHDEKNRVLVFQLNGPLFFGASSNFLKSAEKHKDFAGLILRMHRVPEVDTTGAYALEELAELFKKSKKFLFVSGLAEEPKTFLRKLRILDVIGEDNIFRRFDDAACRALELLRAKH